MDNKELSTDAVDIVPYKPEWPTQFDKAKKDLIQLLGSDLIDVQHIGSTSVINLASKNRIDIQVGVAEISESFLTRLNSRLPKFGFPPAFLSQDHLPPNENNTEEWSKIYLRGCTKKWDFRANVHFRKMHAKNYKYAILFRDYLQMHPEAAMAYADLKKRLSMYTKYDRHAYAEVKDPVCDLIMINARNWEAQK
jgi:dephospho-CoA kinase